jgi:hypothetical protein
MNKSRAARIQRQSELHFSIHLRSSICIARFNTYLAGGVVLIYDLLTIFSDTFYDMENVDHMGDMSF